VSDSRHQPLRGERSRERVAELGLTLLIALASGCAPTPEAGAERGGAEAAADSGFAAVQERGLAAMGVDQYTSTHVFQPLPDGGRIELQRDVVDSAGRARILAHMGEIALAFASGDFRVPGFVHGRDVPGTAVMAARRAAISYVVESLPRGGALRLETSDSSAIDAIHEFLAFQRMDHRTGMHHGE
jgi:hypothetical protein